MPRGLVEANGRKDIWIIGRKARPYPMQKIADLWGIGRRDSRYSEGRSKRGGKLIETVGHHQPSGCNNVSVSVVLLNAVLAIRIPAIGEFDAQVIPASGSTVLDWKWRLKYPALDTTALEIPKLAAVRFCHDGPGNPTALDVGIPDEVRSASAYWIVKSPTPLLLAVVTFAVNGFAARHDTESGVELPGTAVVDKVVVA
jgi:hypothetical protein